MLKQFFKYITQSVAGMIGISVYILADTFFISVQSGADGLALLPDMPSAKPRAEIRIFISHSLFFGA